MKPTCRILAAILTLAVLAPPVAQADVSSVEITERGPIEDGRAFGDGGPYELIAGRVTFAIDPADPPESGRRESGPCVHERGRDGGGHRRPADSRPPPTRGAGTGWRWWTSRTGGD